MSRNWQDIFQKGQGFSNETIAQLQAMEVDLATALALAGGGVLTTKGDLLVYTTAAARLGVGTNGQVLTADSTVSSGVKWATPAAGGSGGLGLLSWSVPGVLTTQTGTLQLPVPASATIGDITIRTATQPTGASIKVDVNKNGTTVFTTQANRPTIAVSTNVSTQAVPDITALAVGDYLTVDIDQVGSTIAGADLVVVLRFA